MMKKITAILHTCIQSVLLLVILVLCFVFPIHINSQAARLKEGKDTFNVDGHLHPKLANTLLKRFPNHSSKA